MAETPPPVVGGTRQPAPIQIPRWIQLVALPLVLVLVVSLYMRLDVNRMQ
jgi:hypothetical protein